MIGQLRRVTAPLDIYVKTPTGIEIVVIYPDAVLLVTFNDKRICLSSNDFLLTA